MLRSDMNEAEVILLEVTLAARRGRGGRRRQPIEAFGLEDTPDAVAVEMRQEVGEDEGQVIERNAGGTPQLADDRPLLFGRLPGQ